MFIWRYPRAHYPCPIAGHYLTTIRDRDGDGGGDWDITLYKNEIRVIKMLIVNSCMVGPDSGICEPNRGYQLSFLPFGKLF